SDLQPVQDSAQIGDEVRVLVRGPIPRGGRVPVPAGVVGDRPEARPRKGVRAHRHIAPGRGEPVQQHNGRAVPFGVASQHERTALNLGRSGAGSVHHGVTCKRKGFPRTARKNGLKMALRDTWHRTLVYFGLAEEEEDGYREELEPEPEAELEGRYRDRPNVRRLQQRRRRDEIDDIFADEPSPRSSRQTRVLRPVENGGGRGGV